MLANTGQARVRTKVSQDIHNLQTSAQYAYYFCDESDIDMHNVCLSIGPTAKHVICMYIPPSIVYKLVGERQCVPWQC